MMFKEGSKYINTPEIVAAWRDVEPGTQHEDILGCRILTLVVLVPYYIRFQTVLKQNKILGIDKNSR